MVQSIEVATPDVPPGVWRVWSRTRGVKRWRLVGNAATKVAAAKLMDRITADLSTDWYVSPPGGESPNVLPAHWRR